MIPSGQLIPLCALHRERNVQSGKFNWGTTEIKLERVEYIKPPIGIQEYHNCDTVFCSVLSEEKQKALTDVYSLLLVSSPEAVIRRKYIVVFRITNSRSTGFPYQKVIKKKDI